jgi:hypothetical protein
MPTKMQRSVLIAVLLAASSCCFGQSWSLGAAGGFGFYRNATLTNATGSANAGFGNRFAAGAVLGENVSAHFGGELRYTFRDGDSELSVNGRQANLDADAQVVHFDFLAYATRRYARVRPFVAGGAGIKRYMGTGPVDPTQPLQSFALLAHQNEVKGLISFGGGVKVALSDRWLVRVDFRDYATPFPEKVIVPAVGVKVHGWLHDFVPLFGVDWTFGH